MDTALVSKVGDFVGRIATALNLHLKGGRVNLFFCASRAREAAPSGSKHFYEMARSADKTLEAL